MAAARLVGSDRIPAFEIEGDPLPGDLWMAAILSNWNQNWNEMDRVSALQKTKTNFNFDEPTLVEEVLPALGLVPKKHILTEYLRLAALEPVLKDGIADGKIPFRGASMLAKLKPEDQRTFAEDIAEEISLTTNQLIQVVEWLNDLLRSSNSDLRSYLASNQLNHILHSDHRDGRQKAEKFYQALRHLRFPRLTMAEERFGAISHELSHDTLDLKIEPTPAFEDEGFWMRAKLRDRESLERVMEMLRKKRTLLNSLFDIML